MTAQTVIRVKNLLRRELSSLLAYLAGAWPWASSAERAVAEQMQRLIAGEQEAHLKLGAALRKARVVPPAGRFPMDFTTAHYLGWDYLLPRLIAEQKGLIADLEQDAAAADEADRSLFADFLALKKKHLAEMEGLLAEHAGKLASTTR